MEQFILFFSQGRKIDGRVFQTVEKRYIPSMHKRVILHIDMDAFFAAVEQRDRPELKGLPVVVGAPPDRRGVVSTCSYEARRYGIHSAMPSRTACQRCPHAVFLPVDGPRYQAVSRQIMALFEQFTPHVQPLSCDEAFLDVTGAQRLFGDGPAIARRIKAAVLHETGLTCSIGVAPNLFLAKIASDLNKPDGLTVVPTADNQIRAFLAPLPIQRMWGIGGKTQKVLAAHGIRTIGDLQQADPARLAAWIGPRAAAGFRRLAFGIDERAVTTGREEKSISNETTFAEDEHNPEAVEQQLLDLADKVGARLRAAGLYAATAHIKLRWKDFSTLTRQRRLDPVCRDDQTLREAALDLLRSEGLHAPVRLIGFGVSGLRKTADEPQLALFQSKETQTSKRREALSQAVDAVRRRFGKSSLRRGSSIQNG